MNDTANCVIDETKVHNYRSTHGAEAYRLDHLTKLHRRASTRRELRILDRMLDVLGPIESAIDIPCGFGRLREYLRARVRGRLVQADFSGEMLELNAAVHATDGTELRQFSALEMPLADREVELALSIRLSHHLNSPEARDRHLRELFRVADRAVIVSWFDTWSLKNRIREFRRRFSRTLRAKNAMSTDDVRRTGAVHGYRLTQAVPLSRLASGHVFGLFERAA